MSPSVIVDDHDPNIHYGGPGWSRDTVGQPDEFMNTRTVSNAIGSTVTYTFNGTALSVWGTIAPGTTSASASYAIDGGSQVTVSTGLFNSSQDWEKLFDWPSLQDGTHTITITTRSGIFTLDFLLFTPSSGASQNGLTLMVDDSDTSITWEPSAQWAALGTFPEFQNTTHDTGVAGSTMQYNFSGTSVSVWGTIQPDIPSTQYVIDGGTPFIWRTPATSVKIFHQLFYSSPNLTAGDHSLVVTVGNNSGSVIIDYLLVEAASPTSASATGATGATATTSVLSSSTSPPSPSTSTPTAAIVGGAVGGVVLLAVLIGVIFYLYRRRRRRPAPRQYFDNENEGPGPTSFVPGGEPTGVYETRTWRGLAASNSTGVTAETDYHDSSVALTHGMQPAGASSSSSSSTPWFPTSHESVSSPPIPLHVTNPQLSGENLSSKRRQRDTAPSVPPPPPPRVHTDGGVRLDVGQDETEELVTELPPVYGNYDS